MTRLSFGLLPVQSAALFSLEQALIDNNDTKVSQNTMTAWKAFTLMTDCLALASEIELITFYNQIVPLLASHGFPFTKFFTTCDKLKKTHNPRGLTVADIQCTLSSGVHFLVIWCTLSRSV